MHFLMVPFLPTKIIAGLYNPGCGLVKMVSNIGKDILTFVNNIRLCSEKKSKCNGGKKSNYYFKVNNGSWSIVANCWEASSGLISGNSSFHKMYLFLVGWDTHIWRDNEILSWGKSSTEQRAGKANRLPHLYFTSLCFHWRVGVFPHLSECWKWLHEK